MSANAVRMQPQSFEGIAVVGEAVRRVTPESAEFLVELTSSGQSAAQALTNHQNLIAQIAQAVSSAGVHRADLQTVSMSVANVFAPALAAPAFGIPIPQIASGAIPGFASPSSLQPELQFGTYQARSTLRVLVREAARAGEVADTIAKSGANLIGGISYRAGAAPSPLAAS